jgi:hypothetical protein
VPKPPSDAVTYHRIPDFTGNNKAHSRVVESLLVRGDGEMHDDGSAIHATPTTENIGKLVGPSQTRTPGKHVSAADLGRELLAALATPGGKNGTAGTGPHTQPETVGLGTAAVIRLEGALTHVDVSDELTGFRCAPSQTCECSRVTQGAGAPENS